MRLTVGNLYVADTGNNTIRMLTPAGAVTTLAGTAGVTGSSDGAGAAASFNAPQGLVTDTAGNLYVADTGNNTIRIVGASGSVLTLAGTAGVAGSNDGPAGTALFNAPVGLAFDSENNLYITDSQNYSVRLLTPAMVVSTFAGTSGQTGFADGTGSGARFTLPTGIAVDANDNLYVADSFFRTIRAITSGAVVTTIAGNPNTQGVALGPLPGSLNQPFGIAVVAGSPVSLVVPDVGENSVLRITLP
jgi:sugar lactone lactonase YvrE